MDHQYLLPGRGGGALPLGALGEIYGYRPVFLAGMAVFAAGSLVCALADSLPVLMLGRALLGLGAAASSATTPALIRVLYPPIRLNQGLGLYATIVGLSFAVGPTAASAILSFASWPWLFLANVPMALQVMLLAHRGLPRAARMTRPFDASAAALCALMLASLLLAIAGMAHLGWMAVLMALVLSALCATALWRREAGKCAPILALDLFRIRLFTLSSATSICAFAIQGLVFVVLPFLFQYRLGYSQVAAGFLITPWPVALALMTFVAARLASRVAPGLLGFWGLAGIAVGLGLLATMPSDVGVLGIAWRMVLCGLGFGLFQSPNMLAIMSSAPRERSGGAGGILAASRLLGQSVGAAAVAFCLSTWPQQGMQLALWCGVALALTGSLISLVRILPWARGM
nr:MFS transporter [Comamonas testosteroni]